MAELPIGGTFALGSSSLASFDNSNPLTIQFSAGVRFWFWSDLASISIYVAQPVYTSGSKLSIPGAALAHSASDVRRLGPSVALGFLGDLLFIGGGIDQLANGTVGSSDNDPAYAPGQVLSRALTITIGFAPLAAARNMGSNIAAKTNPTPSTGGAVPAGPN
jgi:hypothetical protein